VRRCNAARGMGVTGGVRKGRGSMGEGEEERGNDGLRRVEGGGRGGGGEEEQTKHNKKE